jgi:pimeloyl-ACP methyl ester carboxylesterase
MIIKKILKFFGWLLLGMLLLIALILSGFRLASFFRESEMTKDAAPATGRFISLGGDEVLFIQEMGTSTDPAVIFIHGTGAWSETWRETMRVVSEQGFYTVAIDMPPFGYSARPEDNSYERVDQAKRIIGVIDELKLEKVTLVGHSYGGGATAEAAFLAPEKIQALVLVDPALGLHASGTVSPLITTFLKITPVRNAFISATISNPLFTRQLLKLFIANPDHATDEWVATYQRPMNVKGATAAVGEWLPTLLLPPSASLSTNIESYQKFELPTLIVWGEKDSITPLSQGNHLVQHMPAAKLKILPEVGHIPQIEDPAAFHNVLLEFLLSQRKITI